MPIFILFFLKQLMIAGRKLAIVGELNNNSSTLVLRMQISQLYGILYIYKSKFSICPGFSFSSDWKLEKFSSARNTSFCCILCFHRSLRIIKTCQREEEEDGEKDLYYKKSKEGKVRQRGLSAGSHWSVGFRIHWDTAWLPLSATILPPLPAELI